MRELTTRFLFAFILCIGFGILFGYVATAVGNDSIRHFDRTIISTVQGLEAPWLTLIMKAFTWIGSAYVVAPVTLIGFLVLYFKLNRRPQALLLTVVIVGTVVLNSLLKIYFQRERPEIHRILDANGFSFPSGHTMMAFSLYSILGYIIWKSVKTRSGCFIIVLVASLMTILIGVSRIYLGVHFPSDIVGGLLASGLWVTISVMVYSFFQHRNKNLFARTKR